MPYRTTLTLILVVVGALFLIIGSTFYFSFNTPTDTRYNLDGTTTVPENVGKVLSATYSGTSTVRVYTPREDERIGSPVSITGETALPKTAVYYRLIDDEGAVLSFGFVDTQTTRLFAGELVYESQTGGRGVVEVFTLSDEGHETSVTAVPVFYTETIESVLTGE